MAHSLADTGAGLRVTAAGLLTTVQDLGRHGHGRLGLPPAGALDAAALRWANLLVGNAPDAAALELTLLGPTLALEGERPLRAALAGADFGATLDGTPLPPWRAFTLRPGDSLACGACRVGARGYLAVAGGVAVPPALGSRSTDRRGAIGGLAGRALAPGDLVPLAPPAGEPAPALALPPDRIPRYTHEWRPRVVLGPQDDRFTPDAIVTFLSAPYTVAREADRMGLRLDGAALAFRDGPAGADVLSEGVATGAIQVPADGRPIVLLADHQTTGGYAKIAHVIGADLWQLGQARPGDTVRFRAVPVAEAQEALRRHRAGFDPAVLVPAPAAEAPTPPGEHSGGGIGDQVAALVRAAGERLGAPGSAPASGAPGWDPEAVRALLDHIAALGLTEFSLDVPGLRLHLRREAAGPAGATAADRPAPEASPAAPPGDELTVGAPLLGVFYRAARSGEPPLVAPGDVVAPDQPLGLIEVMKTFHPVTAGRRARVRAVLAEDAAPVEYGQPLFALAPLDAAP
jgi:biotin-dependent carboxylase-like uncharacterized protein